MNSRIATTTMVARWNGVNWLRMSAPMPIQTATTRTVSTVPTSSSATRTPKGRHVCGSATGGGAEASESAGMDVGEQDRPRADLVEVVHQLLAARPRHHGAYGDPALPMQRGDGRALQPGGEGDGVLDPVRGHVVVHHHVAAGDQDAVQTATEDLEAGRLLRTRSGDQDRLRLQDHLADELESRRLERGAGLDDVGNHVGHTQLDACLDGPVEPDHLGLDAALLQVTAHDADVGRGDSLAPEVVE